MDVQLALDENHVVTLPVETVRGWAVELAAAALDAISGGPTKRVHVSVKALGWSRVLTPNEAKQLAENINRLLEKVPAHEEEQRRASGYSPRSEEVVVLHDAKGEIAGMTKRFRY